MLPFAAVGPHGGSLTKWKNGSQRLAPQRAASKDIRRKPSVSDGRQTAQRGSEKHNEERQKESDNPCSNRVMTLHVDIVEARESLSELMKGYV